MHAIFLALLGVSAVHWFAPPARAAELITLSPDNYAEYCPRGKEADAVWGDYVLRNEKIVAAVADPTQHNGRSGGRRGGAIHGRLLDLTTRNDGNDLLCLFDPAMAWPNHRAAPIPQGMRNDANKQGDFVPLPVIAKRADRAPKSAATVTLAIPYQAGMKEARYTLGDGWPYLLVENEYENKTAKPITVDPLGLFLMGPFPIDNNPHVLLGASDDLFWVCDPWFGQAYGVLAEGEKASRVVADIRKSWLLERHAAEGASGYTVAPGESRTIARKLIPGRNLFDVRAAACEIKKIPLREIVIKASDSDGPIADARIEAFEGKTLYGIGRTDASGVLRVRVPVTPLRFVVTRDDGVSQSRDIAGDTAGDVAFKLGDAAWADVRITDDRDTPLPCKVRFEGVEGAASPRFFTAMGDERVGDTLQPADGNIRQRLAPGKYRVTVTRGIEYDAATLEIEAITGKTTPIRAKLRRSVETPGWIGAEFTNRSTLSNLWTISTTRGRVLNLLAEGVEFAPSTEVHQVATFKPIIASLHAERWLATEDGINLAKPVRKSFTAQNAFPMKYVPGDQDGGIPQRPAHVFQVYWLHDIPHKLDANGEIITTNGDGKFIQVTPPGIWTYDGRSDGEQKLFDERRIKLDDFMRNARLRETAMYDAMEIQPLDVFLGTPAYDPKGTREIEKWQEEIDERLKQHWPEIPNRNRHWLTWLNMGYRFPGVVNNEAKDNLRGTGFWRTYVQTGEDDPAKLTTKQVIDAVRAGRTMMTNGPFVTAEFTADGRTVGPGADVLAKSKAGELKIRVQCPNWIDVDRVQVLFNGFRVPALEASREKKSPGFADAPGSGSPGNVRFERTIPLKLDADTMVIVLVSGKGKNLRPQRPMDGAPESGTFTAIAMTNPIYIDTDGDGFKPHPPSDDKVFTRIDASDTPRIGQAMKLTVTLKNTGGAEASDTLRPIVAPDTGATLGEKAIAYTLAAGEEKSFKFTVTPTGEEPTFAVRLARSTASLGRRPAGIDLTLNKPPAKLGAGWLYEHAPDLRAAKGLTPMRGVKEEDDGKEKDDE